MLSARITEWTRDSSTPISAAIWFTRAVKFAASGSAEGSAAPVAGVGSMTRDLTVTGWAGRLATGTTERTRRPVFRSARTTVAARSGEAAKAGMTTMSIRQIRMAAWRRGEKSRKSDGSIPSDGKIREDLPPFRNRAGWILTGGRSTRMGRDKALLEMDGTPLALAAARKAGEVCDRVTLVGNPSLAGILGLPVVEDAFPGQGPLAGIEAALRCSERDWNLVLACDMPGVSADDLELIFTAALAGSKDGAVPRDEGGHLEPLCAVYHRRCHVAILEAMKKGIRRVTDALQMLELTYVPVSRGAAFANLNTPEDLRKYKNG